MPLIDESWASERSFEVFNRIFCNGVPADIAAAVDESRLDSRDPGQLYGMDMDLFGASMVAHFEQDWLGIGGDPWCSAEQAREALSRRAKAKQRAARVQASVDAEALRKVGKYQEAAKLLVRRPPEKPAVTAASYLASVVKRHALLHDSESSMLAARTPSDEAHLVDITGVWLYGTHNTTVIPSLAAKAAADRAAAAAKAAAGAAAALPRADGARPRALARQPDVGLLPNGGGGAGRRRQPEGAWRVCARRVGRRVVEREVARQEAQTRRVVATPRRPQDGRPRQGYLVVSEPRHGSMMRIAWDRGQGVEGEMIQCLVTANGGSNGVIEWCLCHNGSIIFKKKRIIQIN